VTIPRGDWRVEWIDILSGEVTSSLLSPKSWTTTLNGTRPKTSELKLETRPELFITITSSDKDALV
jgi:hypothetical protein